MIHTYKKLFTPILFLISTILVAQPPPAIDWQICHGGTGSDYINSITEDPNGGYVASGTAGSILDGDLSNVANGGAMLIKIDNQGNFVWTKTYASGQVFNISNTADGGFIAIGNSSSSSVQGNHGNNSDYYVVKVDSVGNMQWHHCYGGSSTDKGTRVIQANDGDYVLIGTSQSNDGDITNPKGNADIWVAKINANGNHNIVWEKSYGGANADDVLAGEGINKTSDGGYILTGRTRSINGDVSGNHDLTGQKTDAWVVKIDGNGIIQWQKCIGGSDDEIGRTIYEDTDGNYMFAGGTYSNDFDLTGTIAHGGCDYWVAKIDVNAPHNIIWQHTFGGSADDFSIHVTPSNAGEYLICGRTFSSDGDVTGYKGLGDCWLVKYNQTGKIWEKSFGGSGTSGDGYDGANYVRLASDGGIIVACETNSNNNGDVTGFHLGNPVGLEDSWFVKFASQAIGVNENTFNSFSQMNVFPNPSNGIFQIQFAYSEKENYISNGYRIEIQNVLGEIIYSEKPENIAGNYSKQIDLSKYSSGVYLITVKDDNILRKSKIIVE